MTQNVSMAMYQYLCQNIVGSEDHVKEIRLMNAVRDDLSREKNITPITSGSFGEGLEMRGSDLDMMSVHPGIEVYEDVKPHLKDNVAYISMKTDNAKPGFTFLLAEHVDDQWLRGIIEEDNGKFYVSNALFKQIGMTKSYNLIHGPCITNKYGFLDAAGCLHCKTWISSAMQWITRSNTQWPSHTVKQSIIKHGILFVPIGVKGSPKEELQWRISFSIGERLLMNDVTHTQLLCYALLKILLKDVIATTSEHKDLLCSYFLKTILFWISEELPQSVWKPDSLLPCFMQCFSRLIYCVEYSVCLHYFIPENNMFENRIKGYAREILLEKLYTLHRYGWKCILFSYQLSNFKLVMRNVINQSHALYLYEFKKTVCSNLFTLANSILASGKFDKSVLKRRIQQLVSCDQSSIKYLYTYYMSLLGASRAQSMPLNSSCINNKDKHKQYKSCFSYLLKNIYHDAVSGWLMLASLFYKTKQYNKALHIIVYSISKCTNEKFNRGIQMSDSLNQLLKLKFLQKKSIGYIWKIMIVELMVFEKNSVLMPDELQIEKQKVHYIPSLAYAYFLKFLCHYHLNNVGQCQVSIQDLRLIIAESYLIAYLTEKAEVCNLLGIALQLLGDTESARQAFLQSAELDPDLLFKITLKRLSLLG